MYIGVDVGGTNIGVGIVDEQGKIISELSTHTEREKPFEEISKKIPFLIKELFKNNNINGEQIESIGIGLPGNVDVDNGIFLNAPNISVNKFPLRDYIESETGIKTYLDNDAKCAALGEAIFGATKDYNNSITITLGTGVGGGIIINKKIYRGLNNTAGEVGHMVINVDGKTCGCGRKGCWEQYASSSNLGKMAVQAAEENPHSIINKLAGFSPERISAKLVYEAVSHGDQVAKHVLDKYYKYVAEGIINLINILSPEAIAIAGSISKQGDKLIYPLTELIKDKTISHNLDMPNICAAKFGREAGIIGAAALGMQED